MAVKEEMVAEVMAVAVAWGAGMAVAVMAVGVGAGEVATGVAGLEVAAAVAVETGREEEGWAVAVTGMAVVGWVEGYLAVVDWGTGVVEWAAEAMATEVGRAVEVMVAVVAVEAMGAAGAEGGAVVARVEAD